MIEPVTTMYQPHHLSLGPVWQVGDVAFKVYEISRDDGVRTDLVGAARSEVDRIADSSATNGAGWVTVHDATSICYVFANWWVDQNMIRRRGWQSDGAEPGRLVGVADEVTACVWEIPIESYERDRWVSTMLTGEPDIDTYMTCRYPHTQV